MADGDFLLLCDCVVRFCVCLGDVVYNVNSPMAAPDVIFGSDDDRFCVFLMEPDASGNNRLVTSSLVDWSYRESFRLLNFISELRLGHELMMFSPFTTLLKVSEMIILLMGEYKIGNNILHTRERGLGKLKMRESNSRSALFHTER